MHASYLRHGAGHVVDALLEQVRAGQVGGHGGERGDAPPRGDSGGRHPVLAALRGRGSGLLLGSGTWLIRHWISHGFRFNCIAL